MTLEDNIDHCLDKLDNQWDGRPMTELVPLVHELAGLMVESYTQGNGYILEYKGFRIGRVLNLLAGVLKAQDEKISELYRKGY